MAPKNQTIMIKDSPSKKAGASGGPMDGERKYRAEDALRDFTRDERHKSDKALMKDVERAKKQKMSELASVKLTSNENMK